MKTIEKNFADLKAGEKILITSPKSTESFAVRNMRQIANDGEKVDFWGKNFEEENDIQQ